MVLQSTGPISFLNIGNEFGGAKPIKLSDYYLNNASGYTTGVSGIPDSGALILISMFRGKERKTIPTPVQTVFSGTYAWAGFGGAYSNTLWLTGCQGQNLSRTGVSVFNNIGAYGEYRTPTVYSPQLILQARAGDTIRFSVNIGTSVSWFTELIRAYINFGGGYYQIGNTLTVNYSATLTVNYVIPTGTPPGNYGLCGECVDQDDSRFRTLNYYSLHIY
jgi:hypothetical protein